MKEYAVHAKFHQAPAAHHEQVATVRATSAPLAIQRGLREILRRPHIKGKVHREITASVRYIREIPVEYIVEARFAGSFSAPMRFATRKLAKAKAEELRQSGTSTRIRTVKVGEL